VWIRFVPMLRGDGTAWTLTEKCRLVDIPQDTLEKRLAKAKSLLIAMME
jgi:CRP-like cAMP-binding protein